MKQQNRTWLLYQLSQMCHMVRIVRKSSIRIGTVSTLVCLLLTSCGGTASSPDTVALKSDTNQDLSCSYFYFLWGTHAEYERRYLEALDAYEKALICDPGADYIKHKLPLLYIKKGEPDQAIALLEKAIEADSQDTASRALIARLLVQQKMFSRAIDQYEQILDYDADNQQTLLSLGVLLSQTGETKRARDYLRKLVRLNPESYFGHLALARISESNQETETLYMQALDLNFSIDLCYEIARFHLEQEQYEPAIELLRRILDQDPSQEQARLTVVQALLALDQEEAAIAELSLMPAYRNSPVQLSLVLSKLYLRLDDQQQAIDHLLAILTRENNPEALYLLGMIYSDTERFSEALDVLKKIGPEQDEFEDAVFLRAKILHQLERTDTALAMLGSYLADETTSRPMLYLITASLYQDIDDDRAATEILARSYQKYPDNERILFDYGLQLERTGQLDKAVSIMEELLLIKPDHAEALNFIGYSWADAGTNLELALDYIERAIALKPDNGYIQDSLGWVHFRLGNLEQAKRELLAALKLLPEDPHIHDHLGDVYRALGDTRKARASYRKALDLFKDAQKKSAVQKKLDGFTN